MKCVTVALGLGTRAQIRNGLVCAQSLRRSSLWVNSTGVPIAKFILISRVAEQDFPISAAARVMTRRLRRKGRCSRNPRTALQFFGHYFKTAPRWQGSVLARSHAKLPPAAARQSQTLAGSIRTCFLVQHDGEVVGSLIFDAQPSGLRCQFQKLSISHSHLKVPHRQQSQRCGNLLVVRNYTLAVPTLDRFIPSVIGINFIKGSQAGCLSLRALDPGTAFPGFLSFATIRATLFLLLTAALPSPWQGVHRIRLPATSPGSLSHG